MAELYLIRHAQASFGADDYDKLSDLGLNTVKTEIHAGLNEFDFTGLLNAHYRGRPGPENMHIDRKTHFRTLRDTILAWQADEIENPPDTWAGFGQSVEDARQFIMRDGVKTVLALSSGERSHR